jgi:hypothetical protein
VLNYIRDRGEQRRKKHMELIAKINNIANASEKKSITKKNTLANE